MERVGFVGLGIMGTPMARNALKAGFAVTVTNRTIDRAKPLADAGATAVRNPREVAERSDIVVTMVTNTPDVEAVMFGADGVASGAHEGLLAIDMSTISPAATRDLAKRAAANRPPFRTLDARSEEHTSELQSQSNLVCRLLLETKYLTISRSARRNTNSMSCSTRMMASPSMRKLLRRSARTAFSLAPNLALCTSSTIRSGTASS